MLTNVRFLDQNCVHLSNEVIELLITQSVGPRVLSLRVAGGENLFAELPDLTVEYPGVGPFHFWGGHRLWHAPEVPQRTYLPDDRPVEIIAVPHGLHLVQPTESQTGLQKSWHITLPNERATAVIDHTLTNQGLSPVECAPWAITQFKPEGVAILPQNVAPVDPYGLQPNRNIVLWPYTDMNSPHIRWGNHDILVHANMQTGYLKLGFPNLVGWLAYHWKETLFVKTAVYQPDASYFDLGASSQCYCQSRFLELETLGPRTAISPGEAVTHRETWHLFPNLGKTPSSDTIQELLASQIVNRQS